MCLLRINNLSCRVETFLFADDVSTLSQHIWLGCLNRDLSQFCKANLKAPPNDCAAYFDMTQRFKDGGRALATPPVVHRPHRRSCTGHTAGRAPATPPVVHRPHSRSCTGHTAGCASKNHVIHGVNSDNNKKNAPGILRLQEAKLGQTGLLHHIGVGTRGGGGGRRGSSILSGSSKILCSPIFPQMFAKIQARILT